VAGQPPSPLKASRRGPVARDRAGPELRL